MKKIPLLIITAMSLAIFSLAIISASVSPIKYEGNDSNHNDYTPPSGCVHFELPGSENVGTHTYHFNQNGQYDPEGSLTFTMEVGRKPGNDYTQILSWSSNFPIFGVILKGGSAFNLYQYPSGTRSDTDLVCPVNSSDKPASISHVSLLLYTDYSSSSDSSSLDEGSSSDPTSSETSSDTQSSSNPSSSEISSSEPSSSEVSSSESSSSEISSSIPSSEVSSSETSSSNPSSSEVSSSDISSQLSSSTLSSSLASSVSASSENVVSSSDNISSTSNSSSLIEESGIISTNSENSNPKGPITSDTLALFIILIFAISGIAYIIYINRYAKKSE